MPFASIHTRCHIFSSLHSNTTGTFFLLFNFLNSFLFRHLFNAHNYIYYSNGKMNISAWMYINEMLLAMKIHIFRWNSFLYFDLLKLVLLPLAECNGKKFVRNSFDTWNKIKWNTRTIKNTLSESGWRSMLCHLFFQWNLFTFIISPMVLHCDNEYLIWMYSTKKKVYTDIHWILYFEQAPPRDS